MDVRDLRIVRVSYHQEGIPCGIINDSVYYMHESQVAIFLAAQIELHHVAGNKHNGVQLENLWQVTSTKFVDTRRFWWGAVSQQPNDPAGAETLWQDSPEILWQHPKLQAEIERERIEEFRDEFEADCGPLKR